MKGRHPSTAPPRAVSVVLHLTQAPLEPAPARIARGGGACPQVQIMPAAPRRAPGLTPESVHPFVAEVRGVLEGPKTLHWVAIPELLERRSEVKDCQLRILAFRVAHMPAGS